MKKFIIQQLDTLRILGVIGTLIGFGSLSTFGAPINPEEDVVTLDVRRSRISYRQGEVIVKFKASSGIEVSRKNGKFHSASNSAVDQLLGSIGVEDMEPLMPLSGSTGVGRKMKAYNGKEIVAKDLSKLYVVKIAQSSEAQVNIYDVIDRLKALDEVEYAEPNYIMHALETTPGITDTPDDPLYNMQYGISAINLDKLWAMPVISKEGPIIAILDTGVEIDHPDLKDNIWTNEKEAGGSEGYDDDGNGFKDDIHGWDFVNNTGEIYDYNGHGTHCAGIAGARGFNGTGIIGANPDARIMPVTVMQSNGTGDIATIIKGVDYASANGANIISMSLGGYSSSIAYEEALGKAYQNALIVAAAGNDGYCLNHAHRDKGQMAPYPMFPAAYTFVLGVQASGSNGDLASFSNYDDDGPVFSGYSEEQLYNYEITAPGVSITSTYPGGKYKELNGTSMATPLVAGALSRLLQTKEYNNKEVLFGDLIHTVAQNGILDIMATYKIEDQDRKPEIQIVGIDMVDEDGDGRPDAGEWVEFYPTIRNAWGNISNIKFNIESAELINNIFDIEEAEGELGRNLSSYGKAKAEKPVKIKLHKDVADGRIIMLKLTVSADGIEPIEQEFEITAENGVEIGGMITEDTTLYPDVNYIVTNNISVPQNAKLIILPGTKLKFKNGTGISVVGPDNLICNGDKDNFIIFTNADHSDGKIEIRGDYEQTKETGEHDVSIYKRTILSYCKFENSTINLSSCETNHCLYRNNTGNVFYYSYCTFNNNYWTYILGLDLRGEYNNFVNNEAYGGYPSAVLEKSDSKTYSLCKNSNIFNNISRDKNFNGELCNLIYDEEKPNILYFDYPSYWGTSKIDILRKGVWDINNGHGYAHVDLSNILTKPSAEAHGIVWKVEVNGKDAQDEFDEITPLGVGKHEFKVYFNRAMKKDIAPMIAMGVRPPYTQIAIAEDGKWNDDGDIYTAYLTISGKSDYDGLNRIYVNDAMDDENFPIPPENLRFNVYVSAAGSMSNGFVATPGLGKVDLEWEDSDSEIDDVLGYNLYRYTVNEEGIASDTIQINKRLIDETTFTDFDVLPGTTYLYYYKTLRTNMSENSPSKVVAAKPLTASKGDANGSMSVDVADIVTEVSYITGSNPQPFIFEAADVNSDEDINVLDIVGTINIINTPTDASSNSAIDELSTAYFSVEEGTLYVDCDQPIGGVQVRLNADKAKTSISKASDLNGFEEVANWLSDTEYLYMAFSMSGRTMAPGKHALLNINDARITELIASNVSGANLPVEIRNNTNSIAEIEDTSAFRVYPNPATDIVNVDYVMPGDNKVFFVVSNLQGALVDKCSRFSPAGKNTLTMNVSSLPSGVYFIQMIVDGKTVNTYKVIKK